jgi:hypothetical protein
MVLSPQLPDGGPTAPSEFTKSDCERIIIRLILLGVLEEEFAHTAYSTNAYVRLSMEQGCSLGGGLLMRLRHAGQDGLCGSTVQLPSSV